jgi:hypothetical protein
MKSIAFILSVAASLAAASAIALEHDAHTPAGASITLPRSLIPRDSPHKKQKDNWGNAVEKDRKKVTIRASKNDKDDISDDFLWAIKKANNGGLVHLEKGKKYVIGKKLNLNFLKDVYVKIDGELKVCNTHCGIPFSSARNMILTVPSSPTTSSTGKPTTSTTRSKRASRSGFGAESKILLIPTVSWFVILISPKGHQGLRLRGDQR